MRLLFLTSIFLFTTNCFGQACTEADFLPPNPVPPNNEYTCNTLRISAAGLDRSQDGNAEPITINVTLDVEIRGDINLDGEDGTNQAAFPAAGATGGPGAGSGGGITFLGDGEAGSDLFVGANGNGALANAPCASGGGGGALFTLGEDGEQCSGGAVGTGGTPATNADFDFTAGLFRGGFGGGGGGGGNTSEAGNGGGGGGALRIIAGGNVLIASGVTISAKGGDGGDSTTDGGGGGAGSGGALWIQSGGNITNLGTLDLTGGTGGRNNVTNAHGGDGGDGVYQFEDLSGTTNGSGLVLPPASTNGGSGGGSSSKLSSDISCGTLSKASEQNHNNLFMIFAGFGFVSLISVLSRFKRIKVY